MSMGLATGIYSVLLTCGLGPVMLLIQGILLDDYQLYWAMPMVGWALAMWIVATFTAVVRFLGYLDLRIRFEGWEVELRMRAEGSRLAESMK